MDPHPYGIWSVLPPLVAIGLAITTRRVVPSLATGVLVGCMILGGGNPLAAIADMLGTRLWKSFADSGHLMVFAFTMLMGAMVGVISRSGGMHCVVDRLSRFAGTRRGGQLTIWGLGLVVFFDDYANSLLLGSTMRPFADRLKISREKLAYLVDSTAAPVSGLALVSTWVAGEIGFIEKGLAGLQFTEQVSLFGLFVETIPYRFYVLLALAFVMLIALMRRDFGPMLVAEQECVGGESDGRSAVSEHRALTPAEGSPRRWTDAIVPVAVVIGLTLALLLATGRTDDDGKPRGSAWEIFGNGDSYVSLLVGSFCGLLTAAVLAARGGNLSLAQIHKTAWQGALLMVPALLVLWLSWSLADVTGRVEDAAVDPPRLQTGDFLARQLVGVSVAMMPTIIFVVAGAVAFATGTSWGTMGILTPPAIGATYALMSGQGSGPVSAVDPIFLASVGSVLAGAIFGDHCSPISDTTVLSAQASGCNLMAHVWTQMPYALLVGGVSIVCGTLPIGFGVPVWPLLPLGVVVLAGCLFWFGRCAEA